MKKSQGILILLIFILKSSLAFSKTEAGICETCGSSEKSLASKPMKELIKTTEKCSSSQTEQQKKDQLKKYVGADYEKAKAVFANSEDDASSVSYNLGSLRLNPGEFALLAVPEHLANRRVQFVILKHRQNPEYETGGGEKWDTQPGLTSLQFYNLNEDKPTDKWRYWSGSASGEHGAKFAEVSHSYEIENLYEWRKLGHAGMQTGEASHAPLYVGAIKVVSAGKDPVEVGEVVLKVAPLEPSLLIEGIYSPGTEFGNYETEQGRAFSEGQANKGRFPKAVLLGSDKTMKANVRVTNSQGQVVKENVGSFKTQDGRIHFNVPKGYVVTSVEVACGDSHDDGEQNSDGGWGEKGWGKLSVALSNSKGTKYIMEDENVPPEGVMMATPKECDAEKSKDEASEVIISGDDDDVYVMGVRIGVRKK